MYRLALLLLVLASAPAFAQSTGTLAGRITDETGEGLPGANVRINGSSLGASTDLDGAYRIVGVPVGTYDVTASYTGFRSVMQTGIDVSPGSTRTLDFLVGGAPIDLGRLVFFEECFIPLVDRDPFASRSVVRGGSCGFPVALDYLPVSR
jgi:Carboxypeptidase regulatory-like domain